MLQLYYFYKKVTLLMTQTCRQIMKIYTLKTNAHMIKMLTITLYTVLSGKVVRRSDKWP